MSDLGDALSNVVGGLAASGPQRKQDRREDERLQLQRNQDARAQKSSELQNRNIELDYVMSQYNMTRKLFEDGETDKARVQVEALLGTNPAAYNAMQLLAENDRKAAESESGLELDDAQRRKILSDTLQSETEFDQSQESRQRHFDETGEFPEDLVNKTNQLGFDQLKKQAEQEDLNRRRAEWQRLHGAMKFGATPESIEFDQKRAALEQANQDILNAKMDRLLGTAREGAAQGFPLSTRGITDLTQIARGHKSIETNPTDLFVRAPVGREDIDTDLAKELIGLGFTEAAASIYADALGDDGRFDEDYFIDNYTGGDTELIQDISALSKAYADTQIKIADGFIQPGDVKESTDSMIDMIRRLSDKLPKKKGDESLEKDALEDAQGNMSDSYIRDSLNSLRQSANPAEVGELESRIRNFKEKNNRNPNLDEFHALMG